MAGLFHQLSFEDWRWHDPKGNILTVAILLVLWKPSSWQRFALLIIVDWISVGWTLPITANHILFSWLVNGTLLAALVLTVYKDKGIADPELPSRWYAAFAPWVRVELCLLYFFTVFHKLNFAYLDPAWSCGAKLYVELNDRLPIFPVADWAKYLAIYGTLIIETAIPLLLLFRRTRIAAVILGLFFHALLAIHLHSGLFSFSATMTAFYVTFLPVSMAEMLKPKIDMLKPWRWLLSILAVVLLLCYFRKYLPAGLHLEELTRQHLTIGFFVYLIYFAITVVLFLRTLKWGNELQRVEGSWRTHPLLIVFTLVAFVNGFGPYLGLRTQTSFSMFSNLHTENGKTNHLIVPAGIQITNWQHDVVEIIDSNDPNLISIRDNNLDVIFLDLRRMRSSIKTDLWVTFRRNGTVQTFDMTRPETHGTIPKLNLLTKRYFFFRPVERDPLRCRCKH